MNVLRPLMVALGGLTLGCVGLGPTPLPPEHPARSTATLAEPPGLPDVLAWRPLSFERPGGEPGPEEPRADPHAGHGETTGDGETSDETALFACPMHPEVRSAQPGRCPRCGMELVATPPGTKGGTPR